MPETRTLLTGLGFGESPRCVRVREGGAVLQTIDLDRGCFACMLGGPDGRTLFMVAAEWQGMEHMTDGAKTGQVLAARAPAAAAGWPSSG
jgi:sugar lactone lactonase YvrE